MCLFIGLVYLRICCAGVTFDQIKFKWSQTEDGAEIQTYPFVMINCPLSSFSISISVTNQLAFSFWHLADANDALHNWTKAGCLNSDFVNNLKKNIQFQYVQPHF